MTNELERSIRAAREEAKQDLLAHARIAWARWRTLQFVDRSEWKTLAATPSPEYGWGTVHVVAWRMGYIAVVKNRGKSLPHGASKPPGWGIPTGKIRDRETPLEAAARELREERNVFSAEIEPVPIDVTVKQNGHIDVTFSAKIDPYEEIREPVFDPDGGIIDAAFINPLSDIEERGGRFYFRGELFYSSHRTWLFTATAQEI